MIKARNQPRGKPRSFALGNLCATRLAIEELNPRDVLAAVARHSCGDWGSVCSEDKAANDEAVEIGERIVSMYTSGNVEFFIITERDRSLTTILLPKEY